MRSLTSFTDTLKNISRSIRVLSDGGSNNFLPLPCQAHPDRHTSWFSASKLSTVTTGCDDSSSECPPKYYFDPWRHRNGERWGIMWVSWIYSIMKSSSDFFFRFIPRSSDSHTDWIRLHLFYDDTRPTGHISPDSHTTTGKVSYSVNCASMYDIFYLVTPLSSFKLAL